MLSPMINSQLRLACARRSTGGADELAIPASLADVAVGTAITRWAIDHGLA